jgi:hypothetical protein
MPHPKKNKKIKTIKNVVKSLVMLEIQSQENITKQAAYIYCQNFHKLFFIAKVNFLKIK